METDFRLFLRSTYSQHSDCFSQFEHTGSSLEHLFFNLLHLIQAYWLYFLESVLSVGDVRIDSPVATITSDA